MAQQTKGLHREPAFPLEEANEQKQKVEENEVASRHNNEGQKGQKDPRKQVFESGKM
jgi:hypothetical protein